MGIMHWDVLWAGLSPEMLLRIGLTFVSGAVLGLERERHGRAAGLRTILIVSLAACFAMIVSDVYYRETFTIPGATWHPDPARLAAGVLAGMGFLGAGVIIHQQHSHVTRGITTAATLWFSAIVGLCFGSGALGLGMIAVTLSTVILFVLPLFEHHLAKDWYDDISVKLTPETTVADVTAAIEGAGVAIKGMNWAEDLETGERELRFHLKFKNRLLKTLPQTLVARLSDLPGVKKIHWHG